MSRFHPVDRRTGYLLPPSVDEWLPENHLARFIVEVVDKLDIAALEKAYTGRGSAAYHPSVLLALLVYGYATGVFSSRKIERATYDSVAFRFIAAGSHPDHDTLATFRRRFLEELAELFVQVLDIAREMRLLKLGTISLDGTKIHAHASKHRALSQGHIEQLEIQLKDEVESLLTMAEQADQSAVPDGMNLPDEIARRQERLKAMDIAKTKIEARAKVRFEKAQAEYEGKLARREAKTKETGKKPGGKPPKPPEAGPKGQDQLNLTDEESRIMPTLVAASSRRITPKQRWIPRACWWSFPALPKPATTSQRSCLHWQSSLLYPHHWGKSPISWQIPAFTVPRMSPPVKNRGLSR